MKKIFTLVLIATKNVKNIKMKIKYFPTKSSVINITETKYVLNRNEAYIS